MNTRTNLLHPRVVEGLERFSIDYEVLECDPNLADTAAFLERYGFSAQETANAIIGAGKSNPVMYACCVVLANSKLDVNKKLCELLGVKRCSFASAEQTLELTEMQIGGVTPVGLPEMPIYIDASVMNNEKIVLGGGNRSSKLLLKPAELHKIPTVQVIEGLGIPR